MKFKTPKLLLIAIVSFALPLTVSAEAFGEGQCSGNACTGFNSGGYGNQITNSTGTGNLAGYKMVRFDGYRPEPSLTECTPTPGDRSLYDDIGVPSNFSGKSYYHRHVAILRSDTNVATNGVEGSKFWNTGLRFNLDTGETAPATDLDQRPTHSNPWIGPNWEGSRRCLPLRGGIPVDDALKLIKPELKINSRSTSTETAPSKVVVGSKKSKITLDLRTAQDTSSVPEIDINFDFGGIVAVGCDMNKVRKYEEENPGEETPLFYACFLATDKRSPFYIETNGVVYNENGTTEFKTRFKKKGSYGLFVLASYEGRVLINGVPAPLDSTGVSDVSNAIFFDVKSVKSVNRKR